MIFRFASSSHAMCAMGQIRAWNHARSLGGYAEGGDRSVGEKRKPLDIFALPLKVLSIKSEHGKRGECDS